MKLGKILFLFKEKMLREKTKYYIMFFTQQRDFFLQRDAPLKEKMCENI